MLRDFLGNQTFCSKIYHELKMKTDFRNYIQFQNKEDQTITKIFKNENTGKKRYSIYKM